MRAQGRALTRNGTQHMALRTCFKEQYYTDTRRYICVREDCGQYQAETMCNFVMVFHQYLRIDQFVWALIFCGIRYYQFASWDCSGVIKKIHMRKIRLQHGQSTWSDFDRFHAQRALDKPKALPADVHAQDGSLLSPVAGFEKQIAEAAGLMI